VNGRQVFPELVTGRDDQFAPSRWEIRPGWALRGHASCDFVGRVLEVPLGDTEADRVIRVHELMHLRVSPHDVNPLVIHPDIVTRALECAEEFRVNELLRRLGFAVHELKDGSEASSGLRLAANSAWDEAVYFFVATMGTGAEREFLKGVRRGRPEWIRPLGVPRRRVRSLADALSDAEMGSTTRPLDEPDALPRGFRQFAVPLARLLMSVADAAVPESPDQLRQFRRSLEPGGRRPPTGRFAALVFDDAAHFDAVRTRRYGHRARPDVSGTVLRYPSRLVTDPHRRAFARPRRSLGGVVVVDQSGSMDLVEEEIDRLLAVAAGATVVGYSHRPGDLTGRANAWIIAREGARASHLPTGNVGNGVDGPMLAWAAARRHGRDPLIWVTDGQVTDSNDHPSRDLSRVCAELVRRHRIQLTRTVADAADILNRRLVSREPAISFGRVGRELAEMWGVTAVS
jgi:hypothetical protein